MYHPIEEIENDHGYLPDLIENYIQAEEANDNDKRIYAVEDIIYRLKQMTKNAELLLEKLMGAPE